MLSGGYPIYKEEKSISIVFCNSNFETFLSFLNPPNLLLLRRILTTKTTKDFTKNTRIDILG